LNATQLPSEAELRERGRAAQVSWIGNPPTALVRKKDQDEIETIF
jgi:hypothetical protein